MAKPADHEMVPMIGSRSRELERSAATSTDAAPSVKRYAISILLVFVIFVGIELAFLHFTGVLQKFVRQMEVKGGLYVLISLFTAAAISLICIHMHHVAVQFMTRFRRLKAVIERHKDLPPKSVGTDTRRQTCGVFVSLLVGLGLETAVLHLLGALKGFVALLLEYLAFVSLVFGLVIALLAIAFAKAYLMFEFFHNKFDEVEHKLMAIFKDVEADVEKIESALHCKAKPCSIQ